MQKRTQSQTETNNNNVLIIAAVIVVLTIIVMYLRDQQQQRELRLRTLEARIEALEEWGLSKQNRQQNNAGGW